MDTEDLEKYIDNNKRVYMELEVLDNFFNSHIEMLSIKDNKK